MGTRLTQTSFTRGEITPRLDARTNLEQREIGLKRALNGFVHQEGGISNRMGLEFCGQAKISDKPVRLIKFVFNAGQTYMLEFGHYYVRFIKDGGYIVYPSGHANEGEIVEIASPYSADDLSGIKRSQSGDVLTLTHFNYPPKTLTRYSHYQWQFADVSIVPDIAAPSINYIAFTGDTSANTRTYYYLVTAVDSVTNEESNRSNIVWVVGHREANWQAGEYVTIGWTPVTNAAEYNVYRELNGVYAYIGTAQTTSFTDDNIEPDLTATAPIYKNPFANNNNPSCNCYFQQRAVYANSINKPQTLWASKTSAIHNFSTSSPLLSTDAITMNMDAKEYNEIRHLIPMKDLLVFTSNSEWKINGTDGIFQANPMPAAVIQSEYGCSTVEPVISGSMVLFVQAGGSVIRDLGYDIMTEGYDGDELTIFSSHLFEGKEIVYMAYAKEPFRLLYVIFNDGTAAVLTYNKKQSLCGWCPIVTDGKFKSVDVVREGLEDVAYFVVERYINGETVKYIERTKTRIIDDVRKAFLVDSGLSAEFSEPKSVIYGLDHLEGKEVIVNSNGGIIKGLKVENGTITLPEGKEAKTIVVGLPYDFVFETLPFEGENTQGLKKIINYASVKIYNSREDFIFCGNDGSEFRHARCDESINHPDRIFSKDIASTLFALPSTDATIKIKQTYPLPLTILSITADIDVMDNENN